MRYTLIILLLVSALAEGNAQPQETLLLRFPTVNQSQIVFTYAGDLYTVSRNGGVARKMTNHIGNEVFARFSPDGEKLAFTGQYDGNTEVYMIPASGGEPKRLTYSATLGRDELSDRMGPNNIVMTWKNDSRNIVYRSRKETFNDFKGRLFFANVEGGLSGELPFTVGGFCSYAPDGNKIAYNQIFREFRTWKYYQGGMADDIYIYDFNTEKSENITNNKAQDIMPMWTGNKIYYISDRDRRMNLFCYDISTRSTRKITNFEDYDIKFPSLGNDAIVFEKGGALYLMDLATESVKRVSVQINDDFENGRDSYVDAAQYINSWDIAPDGARLCFEGRGEIFSVPAKKGVTRRLTQSPNVHERNVSWSPDGKYIAYISDETGEDQLYMRPQEGGEAIALTTQNDVYPYEIEWSPDGKKIAWSDKKLRLRYVDIQSKQIIEIDQAEAWEIRDFSWSPDSRWLAYTRPEWQASSRIYIFDLSQKNKKPVTDEWYSARNPSFSLDGKFLYFASNRDFNPIYSNTEWNHAYVDMTKVYLMTLTKDTPSPFQPQNDEVKISDKTTSAEEKKDEKKEEKKDAAKTVQVNIDFDGIENRVLSLPIDAANYFGISAITGKVYYMTRKFSDQTTALKVFDLESKKETELSGNVSGYDISLDAKKMVVVDKDRYAVIDLPSAKIEIKDYVDLSALKITVNRREEWKQIFNESWRQMRDFFYAPNLHGVDWAAMREKYGALLPHVNHRADLSYIIGELIGELNCGHAYVGAGDLPKPPRIPLGLLGAKLSKNDKYGYYQIEKILKGANWSGKYRSPLTEIGVNVKEGDYIVAINGVPTNGMRDINAALVGMADKQVELTVNSNPSENNARKVIVTPISDESELYYHEWVHKNIEKVNIATNGQVGYLHVPDMGPDGLNQFVRYFYPQLNKKALIIDVRGNGGGNISPMLIERLQRELDMVLMSRNTRPYPSPNQMILGPKICLLDRYSASDGDLFPYRFKQRKIGTLIGERSWGGTVGIRGSLPFVDGGTLSKPEFSRYGLDGKTWIIEGYGVDPDIEIRNDPAREYKGYDDQLEKGIETALKQLKEKPVDLPPVPPFPTR